MFLLDTDICSYIIRQHSASLLKRFRQIDTADLAISVIAQAELLYGVAHAASKQIKKLRREVVDDFIAHLPVLPWDSAAAEQYALLRVELERKGKPIGAMDIMIAAHALSIGATVVTNNVRHFSVVRGLKVVNWLD